MKITWFGHAFFLIESDTLTVVMDPYNAKIGLRVPAGLIADIVTVSHQHGDHNNISAVAGRRTNLTVDSPMGTDMSMATPIIISTSGETKISRDIHEVSFFGIKTFHDDKNGTLRGENIVFKYRLGDDVQGITIAHLGDLGHVLDPDQAALLQHVDILMIPVGGQFTLDAKAAVEVAKQINPRVVIPMHYGIKGLAFPLDSVELFIAASGFPMLPSYLPALPPSPQFTQGEIEHILFESLTVTRSTLDALPVKTHIALLQPKQ